MNIISACLQVDAAGARITDVYGTETLLTMPLGAAVRLDLDLRGDPDPNTGVLALRNAAEIGSDVAACYFALERDFDTRTEPLLLRTSGITIASGSNGSGAIFSVPIPNTGVAPLISALAGSSSAEFFAEIGALDREGVTLFAHQFAVTVRNRLYMGGDAPESIASDPAYCTAAETRLLAAAVASAAAVAAAASGGYATSGAVTEIVSSGGYATSGAVLALAAPVEVVDGSSTAAAFTAIDGGTVYRFTQPLTALAISAMPSDTREAVVIFSGGTAVNRTPVVSVYLPFMTFDYDSMTFISSSKPLPISATQSGWTYSADSRIWGTADKFVYDSSVEEYLTSGVRTTITSGAISCFFSGGMYMASASDVVFENTWYYDNETVSTTSDVVSGVVASSTDGSTWVPINSTTFPVIYGIADYTAEIVSSAAPAISVTSAVETVSPVQVSLPASAGIVQMPEFTSGGKYVISLQYGLAVGAEYEVGS